MQLGIVGRGVDSPQVSPVGGTVRGAPSSTIPAERASTSDSSDLFKKLEALATSDPEQFKQVTAELATAVKDAADAATDPREKQLLTDLAGKFTEASTSGDVGALQPPGDGSRPPSPPPGGPSPPGAGGGGKPSSSGAAGAPSASAEQYYDPADANQDGKVTLQEQAVYDAAHPSKAEQAYAATMSLARQGRAEALFSNLQQTVAKAS
jgi:hypothetical protein